MELRDILTKDGAHTGKVIENSAPLGAGEYLYHVHIIMKDQNGRYVMQQRALHAKYFPGKWDVTGGGVMHGETGAEAAAREAREELGIAFDPARAIHIGRQVEDWDGGMNGLITDVYAVRVDAEMSRFALSRREVAAVRLVPFEEFIETVTYNKTNEYRGFLEKVERMLP
ncbi:MAG: NUDIX domain-containing protein [Christensenellales bacterium]|jgi:8-oxo-dGTP diphosphatase